MPTWPAAFAPPGARLGAKLQIVDAYVADVPNDQLEALSLDPGVAGVHLDRPVAALLSAGSNGEWQR